GIISTPSTSNGSKPHTAGVSASLATVERTPKKQVEDDGYGYLSPTQASVVQRWLEASQSTWRPATEKDYDKSIIQDFGTEYRHRMPFYAVGDFNRDGKEDFAIILVKESSSGKAFGVAVFNGDLDSTRVMEPTFFTNNVNLGDVIVPLKDGLMVGRY